MTHRRRSSSGAVVALAVAACGSPRGGAGAISASPPTPAPPIAGGGTTAFAFPEAIDDLHAPFDPFAALRVTRPLGGELPAGVALRLGHRPFGGALAEVAASPDGKRYAACTTIDEVWLWDAATGLPDRSLGTAGDEGGGCRAMAFTADSKSLVLASFGSVRVLDVATGKATTTVDVKEYDRFHVWGLAVGPKGDIAVAGCNDGRDATVKLIRGDDVVAELGGFKEDLGDYCAYSVAISADGKRIAAAGRDEVIVYAAAKGEPIARLPASAFAIAFAPDGTLFAAARNAVNAFDLDTKTAIASYGFLDNHIWTQAIAIAGDGRTLYVPTKQGLAAFDIPSRRELWRHAEWFDESLAVTPSGDVIVPGRRPSQIARWTRDGVRQAPYDLGTHDSAVTAIDFLDKGATIFTASDDGTARTWSADGTPLTTFAERPSRAGGLAVLRPTTTEAISVLHGCTVHAWDPAAKTIRAAISLGENDRCSPEGIAITPDGATAAIADATGGLHVVALDPLRLVTTVALDGAPRSSPVIDADGRAWLLLPRAIVAVDLAGATVAKKIATDDGNHATVLGLVPAQRLLVYGTGNEVRAITSDGKKKWTATLSDDEWEAGVIVDVPTSRAVAVGTRGKVVLFDAKTGKRGREFAMGDRFALATSIAISPDGKRLLAGFPWQVLGWSL
jgi:WD40 repeat protein